jgi:hypothetical protein
MWGIFLVDQKLLFCYNISMKLDTNEILQWAGAVFIVAGHSLNAVGPEAYPYNILTFFVGTILFLAWAVRVKNRPQLMVNLVAITIGAVGLFKAVL